jgi:hypothetical protein
MTKKRHGRSATAALVAAVVALGFTSSLLVSPIRPADAESLSSWTITTAYPIVTFSPGCAASNTFIYCIGGAYMSPGTTDAVYFAPIAQSGIGVWTATTSYPTGIMDPSCVISSGYIYCVGGDAGCTCATTSAVYYATVSSSGVGAWKNTTSYPTSSDFLSCITFGSYVYCLGDGTGIVYYAPISSSGVGTWTTSSSYPVDIAYPSCTASGGYMYCMGGMTYPPPAGAIVIDSVYYAPLSSSGVGAWASTTSYPTPIDYESCTTFGGYIYCVGGQTLERSSVNLVYYAPISSSGIGAWTVAASYPTGLQSGSCLASGGYVYCVSGQPNGQYYASIGGPLNTAQLTVSAQGTNGQPIDGYSVVLYQNGQPDASGFSPATFSIDTGLTFVVQADDYGSCHFDHWQDTGSTAASRAILVTGNIQLHAVYACGGSSSSVTIDSSDQNGNEIFGYRAVLFDSTGDVVDAGFTTTTLQTTAGQTYEIQADNFGGCTFDVWFNPGTLTSSANPMVFTATNGSTGFTAVYKCQTSSTINVLTVNSAGQPITGYYTTLWQNGTLRQSCFSPCSFIVNGGQTYQVMAASYAPETFNHWQNDGSTGFETVDVPGASTTISLTAVYGP